MPVPDVRCTKGRQAGTSTHQEKGWTLPHPSSFDMADVFALAHAISFREKCNALHHLKLYLDSIKDKKLNMIDAGSQSKHGEILLEHLAQQRHLGMFLDHLCRYNKHTN